MQSTLQSTVNFVGIFVSFMYVLVKKYRTERAKKIEYPIYANTPEQALQARKSNI